MAKKRRNKNPKLKTREMKILKSLRANLLRMKVKSKTLMLKEKESVRRLMLLSSRSSMAMLRTELHW